MKKKEFVLCVAISMKSNYIAHTVSILKTDDPFKYSLDIELVNCWLDWLQKNEEVITRYDEELELYSKYEVLPYFVKYTGDKLIVSILSYFKEKKIHKPASSFYEISKLMVTKLGKYSIINFIYNRMKEDMEYLEQFKSGSNEEKKKAKKALKERGWI